MGLIKQDSQDYYEDSDFGNYQFTSLEDVINQFVIAYVGEGKIISKIKRTDVAFHAMRALQELSFDTFKSIKAKELTVPATLQCSLPQDYVNYTKISWVDSAGIKHPLYPTNRTSNPTNYYQNSDGDFKLTVSATITSGSTNVVLDEFNADIQIGDIVTGPTIGTWIVADNQYSTKALILADTLDNYPTSTTFFTPTSSITETLTVDRPSNELRYNATNIVAPGITGAPWETGSNLITFDNASDTSEIQVGMVINAFPSFPAGTTVIGVNGKYVSMSTDATLSPTSNTASIPFSLINTDSDTWSNYKSTTPSENNNDDYEDDTYWPIDGQRYGLDPQHAQINGSFYIDEITGKIHFSSNISGKTVILDYISDSLGTDSEMQVHKFAEEAMYKWIAYAILSTRANVQEYIVRRYKKEKFAAIRTAKLRLSNLKLEELTQVLRGKSKQIKH